VIPLDLSFAMVPGVISGKFLNSPSYTSYYGNYEFTSLYLFRFVSFKKSLLLAGYYLNMVSSPLVPWDG